MENVGSVAATQRASEMRVARGESESCACADGAPGSVEPAPITKGFTSCQDILCLYLGLMYNGIENITRYTLLDNKQWFFERVTIERESCAGMVIGSLFTYLLFFIFLLLI